DLFHQAARARALGPSLRPEGFSTPVRPASFTDVLVRQLELSSRLLEPCPPEIHGRFALPPVRPFPARAGTTASADSSLRQLPRRGPFRPEARSPQIRTSAVPAQPPDLRRLPLVTGASRSYARSPRGLRLVSGFCSSAR